LLANLLDDKEDSQTQPLPTQPNDTTSSKPHQHEPTQSFFYHHSHLPEHLHFTVLPHAGEYLVIMFLSLSILIFYLFQLQLLPWINYVA